MLRKKLSRVPALASFIKRQYYLLVILALLIFHGVNNYIWLGLNQLPPFDDQACHLLGSLQCIDILSKPFWGMFGKLMDFTISDFYPPLFHICMAIFNIFFGRSMIMSIMANLPFFALLFLSLYYIGKKMGDKNIGLLASFIVSMYPYVFGASKMPLPDFALTAMVAFSLCCLLYTDNFTNRFLSLLFGVSLGLGMLTKQVFIFFIITPFIFVMAMLFYKQGVLNKHRIINLFISLSIAFIITGFWYLPKLSILLPRYMYAGYTSGAMYSVYGPPRVFCLASFIYYFKHLINHQMLLFFFILFLISSVLFFWGKGRLRLKLYLLSSIIGPYLIFTLINTKESKTTVPYLVVFALISSAGILKIGIPKLKAFLVSLIILFAFFQYFIISYTAPPYDYIRRVPIMNIFIPSQGLEPIAPAHMFFPMTGDFKIAQIISQIEKEKSEHKNIIIGLSRPYGEIKAMRGIPWYYNCVASNDVCIEYFCRLKQLPYSIVSLNRRDYVHSWWQDLPILPDFLILESETKAGAPRTVFEKYQFIQSFTMPDNSSVCVYKKKEEHPNNLSR